MTFAHIQAFQNAGKFLYVGKIYPRFRHHQKVANTNTPPTANSQRHHPLCPNSTCPSAPVSVNAAQWNGVFRASNSDEARYASFACRNASAFESPFSRFL